MASYWVFKPSMGRDFPIVFTDQEVFVREGHDFGRWLFVGKYSSFYEAEKAVRREMGTE